MRGISLIRCNLAGAWRLPAAPLCALLLWQTAAAADDSDAAAAAASVATETAAIAPSSTLRPNFGPPGPTPGIPSDEELEARGAVVGEVLIDNQNIFDLNDPKDNYAIFRLANNLHIKTKQSVVRNQLLFKPGDHYSHRLVEESERILRANDYFYDAWIRPVRYHDGVVDLRVTTKDVWTLNPGFNYGRSGGTNTIGFQLEEINVLGYGAAVSLNYFSDIDRTEKVLGVTDNHVFGTWTQVNLQYGDASDGYLREFTINHPFYSLDTRWAAGVSGIHDLQTDSLWDQAAIIDQFKDAHQSFLLYWGWSAGLQNAWVRRWNVGFSYDEHLFAPVSTWLGPTTIPEDRRFLYPWVEYDLVADDYLKLMNHDQIARTEDFYLGTTASARVGFSSANAGSTQSAVLFQLAAKRGFRDPGTYTLLLAGDFSGRLERGILYNGVMDASARYYLEETKHWLFFTTLEGTKGWQLDLDNQILLGGDNGLRGYPLRYQAGDARALWTVEQRYFSDLFVARLFRVGAAVFFDAGRTWGVAPPAGPSLGLLKDVGAGLRFGNARSGLGNVIHVDVAVPLDAGTSIKRVQFLVVTQQSF